jgi:hypothetical protein
MSLDERVAAATWGALHHLTNPHTGQRIPDRTDHFPTLAGSLQKMHNHCIEDVKTMPLYPPNQNHSQN